MSSYSRPSGNRDRMIDEPHTIVYSRPILSVLILNWNRTEDTSALLADLAVQLLELPAGCVEVLILDNGSDEYPPEDWATQSTEVYRSNVNLGYSGGVTYLIDRCRSPWAWIINNDARLSDGAVRRAYEIAQQDQTSIFLPLVFEPSGLKVQSNDCYWHPVLGWRVRTVSTPISGGTYQIFGDIFVAPLVPLRIVEALELFPPQFHTYGEDIDACYAAAASNTPVMREPGIRLTHRKSSSKPREPAEMIRFECQAARNVIASALVNYQMRYFLAIPLLAVKLLARDIWWRRRTELLSCPRAWAYVVSCPFAAVSLAKRLRHTRRRRRAFRSKSDWSIFSDHRGSEG